MTEKMDFAGGKYTVINDNGKLTALRHGEPWGRDLVGDNLVYWMLQDALRLKQERDALLEACRAMLTFIERHAPRGLQPEPGSPVAMARAAIKAVEEKA